MAVRLSQRGGLDSTWLVCRGRPARNRIFLRRAAAGYDRAMTKKLVILILLVALGIIAAKRLRGD